MATGGIDAVNLILKVLFEFEAEGEGIDMQDLRETTEKFIKENDCSETITQIIKEAIKQFEDFKKKGREV